MYTLVVLFFQNCFFSFFKDGRSRTRNADFVIFRYGLDDGLLFESYLKLIMKSDSCVLHVAKRGITRTF
jgi:hypothetical protein